MGMQTPVQGDLARLWNLNSLIPLTWCLISTLHIPPSLVLSYCPDYAFALVLYLCIFSNGDFLY